jgi:predicted DNA-binding helix-hairpin-helix protein
MKFDTEFTKKAYSKCITNGPEELSDKELKAAELFARRISYNLEHQHNRVIEQTLAEKQYRSSKRIAAMGTVLAAVSVVTGCAQIWLALK